MKIQGTVKILVLLCLFLSQIATAQNFEKEFGDVSREEMEMKVYQKDKAAKAVVLYDKGNSYFLDTGDGYDIQFTRHKKIKIFDKSELSKYAEVSIPYYVDGYGKTEIVKSIEAITHNIVDGQLVSMKLDPSTVYEEKINKDWYNKKFVFPDVQDGAILEYRYILETPFHFNLPDWTFQHEIPTVYSEYQVSMIPFYEYIYLVQGVSKFDYQNSEPAKNTRSWGTVVFEDYIHTYVLRDVPAFKDESFISSKNDYIIKMDFQLSKFKHPRGSSSKIISTWAKLNESLLKHRSFGKYIKNSEKIVKNILLNDLKLSGKNDELNAKQIIDYVKSNFEWNGSNNKYASQTAKQFFKEKTGNVADINLFMIALLNQAKIKAVPVIVSTRNHGKIPTDYPFDHFTNYVTVLVNTKSPFLADGTEALLPYNKIPLRCHNDKGLIVEQGDTPKWISFDNNIVSLENNNLILSIDSISQDIKAKIFIQSTEYEGYIARTRFRNDASKIKEYYEPKFGEIGTSKIKGYEKPKNPYVFYFETIYKTEKLGDNIVFKPFLDLPLSKNTLTQKERLYPVDFIYPWENKFETSLKIPSEFLVAELPKDYKIDNDLVEIYLKYLLEDGNLNVKGSYKFKKSIYQPNNYKAIKQYLDDIIRNFNQPIVLEKKN